MATVEPFRAVRPSPELAGEVAALPYDVYSREEARRAVQGKPLSFLNIDRPETQFPEGQDMYAPEVYEKARDLLADGLARGVFLREAAPCFYLYELEWKGRKQTGLVGLSSIDDYLQGICKKHENTVEEKEQDRIRHVDVCSMQTGPIFLAYREREDISALVQEIKTGEAPLYDFRTEDGIGHRAWQIADPAKVEAFRATFARVPATYIADGHHRAASAVKVGLLRRESCPGYGGQEEFNYFLSVLFPDTELEILAYNRVVKDLAGHKPEAFLDKLSAKFQIVLSPPREADSRPGEDPAVPGVKGEFGLYLDGKWYSLRARDEILAERASDPVSGLDVSLLQDEVLSPLLGIGDPRRDKRIEFVGGIRPPAFLAERVRHFDEEHSRDGSFVQCGPAVAFLLYPTGIGELFAAADAGLLMPPKSTWFEPKLRSGLFLHEIERAEEVE